MAGITAELVAVERPLRKGKATLVSAQTTEDEIGVLPGHQPLLGQLVNNGTVIISTADGEVPVALVQGGFVSVPISKVSILTGKAIWADEVNLSETKSNLTSDDPTAKTQTELEVRMTRRAPTN